MSDHALNRGCGRKRLNLNTDFKLLAQTLVDQHYASGPERLKDVLAQAFAELSGQAGQPDNPRAQLLEEVRDAEKASERGSE